MAELRVRKQENLKDYEAPFDSRNNYQKVLRFGDDQLKATLSEYINHINTRNEKTRITNIYNRAKHNMSIAKTESDYREAAHSFESISKYEDAAALAETCYKRAETSRKDAILSKGKSEIRDKNYQRAISYFESIPGWRDADKQITICQEEIEKIEIIEIRKKYAAKRKKILAIIFFAGIALGYLVSLCIANGYFAMWLDLI